MVSVKVVSGLLQVICRCAGAVLLDPLGRENNCQKNGSKFGEG